MMAKTNKKGKTIDKVDIILFTILLLIIFLIVMLFSYAYYNIDLVDSSTPTNLTASLECLDVSYSETGDIKLNSNFPVTDDYATSSFTPIEVKITNNCTTNDVNYTLALSTIYQKVKNYETDYMTPNVIRTKITKQVNAGSATTLQEPDYLTSLGLIQQDSAIYKFISNDFNTKDSFKNYSIKNIYNIENGTLKENDVITYKIYLWVDYYEGAPGRLSNDEYNNSTQGKDFGASVSLVINTEKPTFTAEDLIASGELWQSGLEGDGYRYTGTNPDNYICFGTTDKTECTSNPNTYMYRIIGVFASDSGKQHLKLIKYASLPSEMKWNDTSADVDWGNSTLYSALNGTTYLTNTTYVPSGWEDKITNWKWSAVNTLTDESSGPNYWDSLSPTNIYLHEMNRNSKTSNKGEWTTPSGKIGLMYVSDYVLSLGETAKNMTGSTSTNKATLKTGWMHITNNADPSGSSHEWTVSRYGQYGSNYSAWRVGSVGYVHFYSVNYTFSVRPVFYLTSDTTVKAGTTGTKENPYIIE